MKFDPNSEEDTALLNLYRAMRDKGWPKYEDDPEVCMERAREFLDAARIIYPNA